MSGRGGLNRAYEDNTPVKRGSMMELAQLEGLLHTHIKKEVETALQREVGLFVRYWFYFYVSSSGDKPRR